jgi:hypothetical protein
MSLTMLEKRRVRESMQHMGQLMASMGSDIANAQRDARFDQSTEMLELYAEVAAEWGYAFSIIMGVFGRYEMAVLNMRNGWAEQYRAIHGQEWTSAQVNRLDFLMADYEEKISTIEAKITTAEITGQPFPGMEYFARFIEAEHEEEETDE